ncbi:hypothetical protein M2152_001713 [Microbacteriaceae bacterium SG_E_30_P1]|uniref:DUF1700 domain-containing protein n=1 Tax=Antiquaquibacter oligotrophicus TaxID=2880260 RepID=A0ABT6KNF6_9MICO|nr:permease prefix domain 1-containing protein [Antiquaquibacter oligotrophicus]MDH6181531.1 hypothetical protein [Antiquaquibacter oligotrophicus]UDF12779.1 permease prefix domain 1-containing protein [Antiquaquibacter oligotrophicus]
MIATLTDRYVAELSRLLPARQRKDIERELRASIADTVDERVERGMTPAQAERDALAELGDPVLLAADYTDRPTSLIGPHHFGSYRRMLGIVVTAGPGVAIVVAVAQVLYAVPLWQALVSGVTAGLIVSAVVVAALTLVFAIIERLPRRAAAWEPTALPDRQETVGGTLGGLAFLLGVIALLVLSPTFTAVTDAEGNAIPVIAPALWANWAPVIVGIVVLAIVFSIVIEYAGWSIPIAIVNAAVVLAGSALFVWWATHDLFLNREFFAAIGWDPAVPGVITVVALVLLGINAIVEISGGFLRAVRSNRARRDANAVRA